MPSKLGSGRPGMMDVALLAGVSHQTVSRVINMQSGVKATTRIRVQAAIEELGYRRNHAARTLATGRSQTLGVVMLNSTLYGPASTLYGIEQAALSARYLVTVASARSKDRSAVQEAIGRLVDQAVEGIVMIAPLVSVGEALAALPTDLPVVMIEGDLRTDVDVVTVDQTAGAKAATQHLLDCGHATVWHVAGPAEWVEARQRTAGWHAALEEAGADIPPPLSGDWSARSGFAAGRALARIPDLSAVFVANDSMALGVMRAMYDANRRVPADVSIVGFDDIPEAAYFTAPLTTVRQDFDEVGRSALALLVDQMRSGPRASKRIVVTTTLAVRSSAGPPNASRATTNSATKLARSAER
ncbi:MAG TPA: LacI family DNA-binding transcriptional regulator [Acidothermaceae bacterium]